MESGGKHLAGVSPLERLRTRRAGASIRSLCSFAACPPPPFENEKLFEAATQYDPTRWAITPNGACQSIANLI
jgi:hypothetical protein